MDPDGLPQHKDKQNHGNKSGKNEVSEMLCLASILWFRTRTKFRTNRWNPKRRPPLLLQRLLETLHIRLGVDILPEEHQETPDRRLLFSTGPQRLESGV